MKFIERLGCAALPPIAEDVSGVTPLADRPKGSQILKLLENGTADGVVWYNVDRFFRDDLEARLQVRQWLKAGIVIYFTDSGQLKSESDIMFLFTSWMAGSEREKIASRTLKGKYGAVRYKNRVIISSTPPYGYDYASGRLTINQDEAPIVRSIYRWYTNGLNEEEVRDLAAKMEKADYPYRNQRTRIVFSRDTALTLNRICTVLHVLGVPCRSDSKPRPNRVSGYAEWQISTLSSILSRTAYYGEWTFGKEGKRDAAGNYINEPVSTPVPAIITREVWDAAQEQAVSNKKFSPRNTTYEYLLGGRVRCQCGYTMYGHDRPSKHANGMHYRYYMCSTRTLPATFHIKCKVGGYRVDKFDEIVWGILKIIFSNPDNLTNGIKNMQWNQDDANSTLQKRIEKIDRRLSQLDVAEELLIDQLSNQVFSPMVVERKMQEVKTERLRQLADRKEYAKQLHSVLTNTILDTFESECAKLSDGLDNATFEDKRRYLKILGAEATLSTTETGEQKLHLSIMIHDRRITLDDKGHVIEV